MPQNQTESKSKSVEEPRDEGLSSSVLLAVVAEIKQEWPKYAPPSATATVLLFDPMGGQTQVEIPIMAIVDKLECGARYHLTLGIRKMAPGESFS